MNRFDGKVALITGAASGLGRAVALRLASEGAQVFAVDIDDAGLASTQAESAGGPGRIEVRRCDISAVAECAAAVAACVGIFGRIDVLGNIAGISWQEHATEVTEQDWDRMFGVNVKGLFFLTQAALPHLLESEGNVVNIASNAGLMGMAYLSTYCATKGAVVQITRALAMEFAKTELRVNAIAPGGIDTPMTQNYRIADNTDWALIRPGVGLRDMSQPEDIAAVFAFLASDEAESIHGAIVSADGGLTTG